MRLHPTHHGIFVRVASACSRYNVLGLGQERRGVEMSMHLPVPSACTTCRAHGLLSSVGQYVTCACSLLVGTPRCKQDLGVGPHSCSRRHQSALIVEPQTPPFCICVPYPRCVSEYLYNTYPALYPSSTLAAPLPVIEYMGMQWNVRTTVPAQDR